MTATHQVLIKLQEHNAKDLLRFITCGNVDDGKSTLIGRLLLEAGAIYEDQIVALQAESSKHGTTGDRIDTALLLDGLEDERQQGITIDVAYRYFTTATRKFIIADSPGHEQFTRNMATGASTAELAILLIDATKGISVQTRRHAYIVSLLGIKQVVLAINKMDLVDYSQAVFQQIVSDFDRFAVGLPNLTTYPIPLSALEGDNVVQATERMPWYAGRTLLEHLNAVDVGEELQQAALRFPIQWVNRPDATFRGFSGTIASGTLQVGDDIAALPEGQRARIKSIVTMDGPLQQAKVHDSITVTLDREIDLTRGDMLVRPGDEPQIVRGGQATVVWMSEQPLVPGKRYWLKHTTRRTPCEIETLHYRTDVNTLERVPATVLKLNEIGRCQVRTTEPIMIDPYSRNRQTGAFIIVDRITHETVGAGMFLDPSSTPDTPGHWDEAAFATPPQRRTTLILREDRQVRYRQQPLTVLITGLSSSGKTSVAMSLEKILFERGNICVVLDGQGLRMGISRDLAFSAEERSENLRRAAEIARLLNDAGQICLAAFVAPSAWVRNKARELIGGERFFHVHLSTSVDVCRQRDITGQYQAADRGEIANFPGVTFEYEIPVNADLVFDTDSLSAEQIAIQIFAAIHARWLQ
jgi:bifunctional enzyme CysN/CysC